MSQTQTLQEMDDNAFLAKVDTLMEHLERQVSGDSVGDWAVSAIKAEIRRRVSGRTSLTRNPELVPIVVEVTKLSLRDVVSQRSLTENFNGTPYCINAVGREQSVSRGFFSASEADAYLDGLRTASELGLLFKEIPCIEDISEEESFWWSPD